MLKVIAVLFGYALAWAVPFAVYVAVSSRKWLLTRSFLRIAAAGIATSICVMLFRLAYVGGGTESNYELYNLIFVVAMLLLVPLVEFAYAKKLASCAKGIVVKKDTRSPNDH